MKMSSANQRRLERLEALVEEPESPDAGAHEKIRRALDRVAFLRRRQGVAADHLSLKSDEDREAWAIFERLGEIAEKRGVVERGRGVAIASMQHN
jgi:hypothetical protein